MSTPPRARIRTIEYRIPFTRPLVTAAGVFHERRGFWILATDEDGRTGLGEVAPLPGGAPEGIDEARRWLAAFVRENRVHEGGEYGIQEDNGAASDRRLEPPAVRAGIELAFLDLAAQREGVRVCDLLAKETGAIEIRDTVSCNALLREVDPTALAGEAAAAVATGYRTVKVKIGTGTPDMDVRRIAAVRKSVGPEIRLRADANGAWDIETAIRALHDLEPFDLEYVEQPTATDLAAVRGRSRVRIAARRRG
jgi:o-succinylbenzoate synthase